MFPDLNFIILKIMKYNWYWNWLWKLYNCIIVIFQEGSGLEVYWWVFKTKYHWNYQILKNALLPYWCAVLLDPRLSSTHLFIFKILLVTFIFFFLSLQSFNVFASLSIWARINFEIRKCKTYKMNFDSNSELSIISSAIN